MARSQKRTNVHHLLWPRTHYSGVRKEARQLPCLQVNLDIEVHRILHMLYGPPKLISIPDATRLLDRHRNRDCACYKTLSQQTFNILAIKDVEDDG